MFGALAHTLLSWVAEGRASLCNCSPPAEARPGQEWALRPYVHRQAPNSRGEGGPPFPAGQSPVWAGAPRVWALRPVCCSAGAEQ